MELDKILDGEVLSSENAEDNKINSEITDKDIIPEDNSFETQVLNKNEAKNSEIVDATNYNDPITAEYSLVRNNQRGSPIWRLNHIEFDILNMNKDF